MYRNRVSVDGRFSCGRLSALISRSIARTRGHGPKGNYLRGAPDAAILGCDMVCRTTLAPPAIAFDLTPLQNAHRFRGIGTYVRGLATRLAAQSDVSIEFWTTGDLPFDIPSFHGVRRVPKLPAPQYRGAWLFAQLGMRRAARKSGVHAVHITDPDALTPLRNHKLLATVYDLIPLKEGLDVRRPVAWAGYRSYLHALKAADVLFAISRQTATDVSSLLGVPAGRIVIAPPGIDVLPGDGQTAGDARPYFLFLGGPNPNKNLTCLLDAMALNPDLPEELLVAGRWLPRQIGQLEASLGTHRLTGRVRHIGFVPSAELPNLMRQATALVIPSLDEGFGLPVGEGLAAGAVVVHSRIPVLEEVSAGNALTFDPHSSQELGARLRTVSEGPGLRADLHTRGRDRALALTWDLAIEGTLRAYRQLLGR